MILMLTLALISAPPPDKPLLLSFDEVRTALESPGFRLLDARSKADYDKGHIPGAVWVDVKAGEKIASGPKGFDDAEPWERWSAPLGIGPDTKVVVYDGGRQLDAARTWWFLSYLGVKRAGLMNGNFGLWTKEKRPTTSETTKVEPLEFPVRFAKARLARRSTVLDILAKKGQDAPKIVDARSLPEHTGERAMSKRGGRIPEACHVEWTKLVDENGRFLDEPALRATAASAGVKPGESVVTHCQGGGRASVDAFVFERLGHPAANYYLGWSDWGNAADTPVTKGK